MNTDKYKYLAKNAVLFLISSFGSKILSFLFVSLYTTVLSTDEYGTADLITTTSSLLFYIVTLNISDSVVRFSLEKTDEQKGIFSYGLRTILKGLLYFGMAILAFSFINPINWDRSLYLMLYITLSMNSFYQLTTYYLRSIDEVKSVAISGVMVTFSTILSNIVLLLVVKAGVIGYLLSSVFGNFVGTAYSFYVILREDKFDWNEVCDDSTKRLMLFYSLPLIFNGISWWINNSLDRYLITLFCGISVNGVFAVASKIPTLLTTFQNFFAEAWSISAIKEYDRKDEDGFFSNMYTLYNSASVIGASFLIAFNVILARFLFSKDFFVAWNYSSVLVVSTVFSGLAGFAGGIFSVVNKTGFYALSTIIAAIINTILNMVFIPKYGALGASITTLISFVVIWGIRIVYASKYIEWKINFKRDLLSYILLMVQLLFDHMNNHFYVGQIVVIVVIFYLYGDVVKKIITLLFEKIRPIILKSNE